MCSLAGFISQQGYEHCPAGNSQKIIYLTGYIFGMLLCFSFSANIITTLTSIKSLNNFGELMDYQPINIAVSSIDYFQVNWKNFRGTPIYVSNSIYLNSPT